MNGIVVSELVKSLWQLRPMRRKTPPYLSGSQKMLNLSDAAEDRNEHDLDPEQDEHMPAFPVRTEISIGSTLSSSTPKVSPVDKPASGQRIGAAHKLPPNSSV